MTKIVLFGSNNKATKTNQLLQQLLLKVEIMAGELEALQAQVAANTTVIESAITLIAGIKAALDAAIAAGDPAALTALSAALGTEDQKLADAVAGAGPVPTP